MKGHLFSIEKAAPCPDCGTPRVGYDMDDTYSLQPGIKEVVTCSAEPIQVAWEHYPAVPFAALLDERAREKAEALEKCRALLAEPCPECGSERVFSYAERDTLYYYVVSCAGRDRGYRIHPIEGCDKCCENYRQ